jgi:arginase
MKTIRLIFPQWQGARLQDGSIPEVPNAKDVRLGYSLGAKLLELLVPENKHQKTIQVPVSTALEQRPITFGVSDRDVIVKQAKEALNILEKEDPERIITLGGECSVSVTPFTYLAKKYQGDVAVLWISAFPNLSLPGDSDAGFH